MHFPPPQALLIVHLLKLKLMPSPHVTEIYPSLRQFKRQDASAKPQKCQTSKKNAHVKDDKVIRTSHY